MCSRHFCVERVRDKEGFCQRLKNSRVSYSVTLITNEFWKRKHICLEHRVMCSTQFDFFLVRNTRRKYEQFVEKRDLETFENVSEKNVENTMDNEENFSLLHSMKENGLNHILRGGSLTKLDVKSNAEA